MNRCFSVGLVLVLCAACGGGTEGDTGRDRSSSESGDMPAPSSPAGADDEQGSSPGMTSDSEPEPSDTDGADDDAVPVGTIPVEGPSVPSEPSATEPDDPSAPSPGSSAEECSGKECGEPCGAATGRLAGPLACNGAGECVVDPSCDPVASCSCEVPAVCQLCDDGSCAVADVACLPDGGCGEITWVCPDVVPVPDPVGGDCTATCPVPKICQVCDDGSCAAATVACEPDGGCGEVSWECSNQGPAATCRSAEDCGQLLVFCQLCTDGSSSCPTMECVDGQCVTQVNECEVYDPCADKGEGDNCTLCPPNAVDCLETEEVKTCQGGQCLSGQVFQE